MVDIPEATDMYRIAKENDKEEKLADKHSKRIVCKIKRRANKGYYSTKILWSLYHHSISERLKFYGYSIIIDCSDYWIISWDKTEKKG